MSNGQFTARWVIINQVVTVVMAAAAAPPPKSRPPGMASPSSTSVGRRTQIDFDGDDDVSERVARPLLAAHRGSAWDELPPRARKRLSHSAKKALTPKRSSG